MTDARHAPKIDWTNEVLACRCGWEDPGPLAWSPGGGRPLTVAALTDEGERWLAHLDDDPTPEAVRMALDDIIDTALKGGDLNAAVARARAQGVTVNFGPAR